MILDKKTYEHDLKDFYFTFIELPKFTKNKIEDLDNIIEKWCYFLKYAAETTKEDLKKIIGSDAVIERAYEALDQFNWTENELIAYEQETKRVWDNRAVEEYKLAQAETKGRTEGKAEGEKEKAILIAKKMMARNKPIEEIMELTELTAEEIKALV